MLYIIAVFFLLATVAFYFKLSSDGTSLPFFRGLRMRRWVEPHDTAVCRRIIEDMKIVCQESLGSLTLHPMFHGDTEALGRRIVMILYQQGRPVMFHAMLKVDELQVLVTPVFYIGLVMVVDAMKHKGLQKFSIFNLVLVFLNYRIRRLYLTYLGRSASALRVITEYLDNPYPDYRNLSLAPSSEQVLVSKHVLLNHKPDLGICSAAKLNVESFILEDCLQKPTLIETSFKDGMSRKAEINDFIMERMRDSRPGDALFCIAVASLKNIIWKIGSRLLKGDAI